MCKFPAFKSFFLFKTITSVIVIIYNCNNILMVIIENKVSFWFRLLQQAISTELANYFNAIYPYIHIFALEETVKEFRIRIIFFFASRISCCVFANTWCNF